MLAHLIVIWTTTPWTIPGNRAISFSPKIEYGLYRVVDAPADNWAKPVTSFVLADKLAVDVLRQARVTAFKKIERRHGRDSWRQWFALIRSRSSRRLRLCRAAARRRSRHRRHRHRLRAHRARSRPRRLRRLDRERGEARGARHQHHDSLHRRCRWPLHRAGAGLHRQARAHRQGREGRRQRRGDQGADRRRHADRARPAQASISAFVALEEAGDLPQHAAMVHRDGQGHRGRRRHAAPSRARSDQSHALGAGAGREPHQRHDREPARLGDLAPARLGRADHGVRAREGRRLGRNPPRRSESMRASPRRSSRKAPTPGMRKARASASSARAPTRTGRRSTISSTSGSIPARRTLSCSKTRKFFRRSPISSARPTAGPRR